MVQFINRPMAKRKISMSISIGNLNLNDISASERRRIADKLAAMSYEDQKQFIEQLETIVEVNARAEAETTRKKTALERINAAKADVAGGRATIELLNGTLRRGGLPTVEELVDIEPRKIMDLFASASKMSISDRMACKSTLSKLRVIP